MILSGMGSMEMMEDNLSAMARPGPLGEGGGHISSHFPHFTHWEARPRPSVTRA